MREFDLLSHIYRANDRLGSRVTIPPGDDMGALRVGPSQVLVTVDQVADGVHFHLATTPLAKIARKLVARNLSDVAAMAAAPVGAVCAACLPRTFGQDRALELFDALRQSAQAYDCPVFGGDVSMWDHPLIMSLTVLARPVEGVPPILRRGAKAGDVVCVTGRLGGSLETVDGRTHHLDFEPRLTLARALAADPHTRPHCMIDLSDGLARDLGHLCAAAGLGAVIEADRLPVSEAARVVSRRDGQPAWRHAVGDGEDYELCFTISVEQAARLPAVLEGVELTQIGRIVEGPGAAIRLPDGSTQALDTLGWEHHG